VSAPGDAFGPLRGVTVLVTRSLEQAAPLAELLEARGATVVVMPLIRIVDHDVDDQLRDTLAGLTPADWVVIASPNAANRVAPMVHGCAARIATVGAATAALLARVDLRATRQSAEGLVEVFPSGAGRVVVIQASGGAPTLTDGLAGLGWTVQRIDTHHAAPVVPTARDQLQAIRADVVLFTSGSQARAWVEVFGTAAPAVVVAIGPQTAAESEAAGLKVSVVAADHSLAGSVEALVGFFAR
jgi:uroporphyrinogen-III synthase